MSVIVSLSPWSSFWTMGKGGGTPSDFVAVECLKKINPQVLHFVEDGSPCDEGNILIPVHPEELPPWQGRILRRLGLMGHRCLFEMTARKWRQYNVNFFVRVIGALRERNVNSVSLVYCHSPSLVECGRRLGGIFKCPVVSHFYGTWLALCIGRRAAYWEYPTEYLGWTTPVDLRICNDDGSRGLEVARDLGLPLEKFLFQPHGLDVENLNAPSDFDTSLFFREGMLHVMTASRLVGWKRLDRLIRAVSEVTREFKNVHFLILGDGPERQKLESLLKDIGAAKWVTFVGAVPRQAVFTFMQRCDIFVSTNDVATSRGVKEAMYFGMCVVAANTGDTRKLIKDGDTGRLLPPDDISALSQALIEVLSKPETRASLGRAAKTFIETHEPTQDAVISERIVRLRSVINAKSNNHL